MNFTFDSRKAAANLRKRKVSFDEAVTVFSDTLRTLPRRPHSWDERRYITLGQSTRGRILFVVYTESDSSVRLIGARVDTAAERKQYEKIS